MSELKLPRWFFVYVVWGVVSVSTAILGVLPQSALSQESDDALDSNSVAAFEVDGTTGQPIKVEADNESKLTVLFFTGIECPLAKLYAPRVSELAESLSSKSIRFFGINSNQQDSMEEFAEFVEANELAFPCGKDIGNVVADRLSVKRTPEVIVLDQNMKIRYRGRIDDQYSPGIARKKPRRHDLKIAIDELLAGKPVTNPKTEPEGCLLGRVKKPVAGGEITFAKQISRVLQRNCVECHRDGEIGPFVLDDYEEVVGWADMIVETIDNGRMPPWHADPAHGSFRNERFMSKSDKDLIRKWVADGAPMGDKADLPEKQTFVTGWRLPKDPDQVIAMRDRPFTVPSDGTVEYQYFVVDPGFKEDKWVSAAEVVPGARSVVHHSIVFVRPPDGARFRGVGWLGAYVPGQKSIEFDPTRARLVPAGSKLVFQQHYTPNGIEQEDITKIGLVFADENEIENELLTLIAMNQEFEIKPNDSSHLVKADLGWFPRNGKLLSVSPHMHFRGKSFIAKLGLEKSDSLASSKTDDRSESTLLSVPNYDFNWQHIYQLTEPIELDDVSSVSVEVTFDNSADNPFNPDPDQFVTWGDQTWEEMAIGFFDVSVPRNPVANVRPRKRVAESTNYSPESQKKIDEFVNDFFDRFDANKDNLITRDELPLSTRGWAYRHYEADDKPGLSRKEIANQASIRFANDE